MKYNRALLGVILGFMIGCVFACSLFGGSTKPVLMTELDSVQKGMAKMNDKINGNSNTIEKNVLQINKNSSTITTIQSTTVHETPFWKISLSAFPWFLAYLIWRLIRSIKADGGTIKKFLFGM